MKRTIWQCLICLFVLLGLTAIGAQPLEEDGAAKPDTPPSAPTEIGKRVKRFVEPSPDSIPIRVGDLIHILMVEDAKVTFHGELDASGFVILPYLGEVRIAGLTETACGALLKEAFEKDLYQKATVTVRVIKRAPGTVYIYGAVKQPGPIPLPEVGNLSILQAIAQVNGITAWASPEACTVTRLNPIDLSRERITVDLVSAFKDIGGAMDINLMSNDVVFVPTANSEINQVLSNEPYEVIVIGQVNNPGIVLFAPGEQRTFMRALFKAGNFTRFAKKKAVRLIRYEKEKKREVETINAVKIIDEGFLEYDVELNPGDMIIVDEKLINF